MALVNILDTLKDARGNAVNATFTVRSRPTAGQAPSIASGSVVFEIAAGVVDIELYPGSYTVDVRVHGGRRKREEWVVPAGGPFEINQVRQYA